MASSVRRSDTSSTFHALTPLPVTSPTESCAKVETSPRARIARGQRCSRVAPGPSPLDQIETSSDQARRDPQHLNLRVPPVPPRVFVDVHRSPPTYNLRCSDQDIYGAGVHWRRKVSLPGLLPVTPVLGCVTPGVTGLRRAERRIPISLAHSVDPSTANSLSIGSGGGFVRFGRGRAQMPTAVALDHQLTSRRRCGRPVPGCACSDRRPPEA